MNWLMRFAREIDMGREQKNPAGHPSPMQPHSIACIQRVLSMSMGMGITFGDAACFG